MSAYVVRRVLAILPVMLVVATVVFAVLHLVPGDPAAVMLGPEASPEMVEALHHELGLDRPLLLQLISWFRKVLTFDLGESLFLRCPVEKAILQHLEATLLLGTFALLIAVISGVALGVLAAITHGRGVDRVVMVLASIGVAIPNFWLGLLLILVFALLLRLFPVVGYAPLRLGLADTLRHLFLPAVTLGTGSAALIARMTRAAMLDVLREDYIRTARAKGLSEHVVVFKHALRNALVPTVTVIGFSLAGLMGGAVVTESIFNIPGVGRLLITGVLRRDYPLVQGVVMYVAATYVLINLLVDIVYTLIDPRVSY
ncbi:MAG: ABC transporter permease, partial [Synergistales bacterium]|nr:ABC transporter permease [Synergistales bacterium]